MRTRAALAGDASSKYDRARGEVRKTSSAARGALEMDRLILRFSLLCGSDDGVQHRMLERRADEWGVGG